MPAKCFECGEVGHIAPDCPQKIYADEINDKRPPWCGKCDRDTRLVYFVREGRVTARRCPNCSPHDRTLPPTYARCPGCKRVVYAWDRRSECGSHKPVGKRINCSRPECKCHENETEMTRK